MSYLSYFSLNSFKKLFQLHTVHNTKYCTVYKRPLALIQYLTTPTFNVAENVHVVPKLLRVFPQALQLLTSEFWVSLTTVTEILIGFCVSSLQQNHRNLWDHRAGCQTDAWNITVVQITCKLQHLPYFWEMRNRQDIGLDRLRLTNLDRSRKRTQPISK